MCRSSACSHSARLGPRSPPCFTYQARQPGQACRNKACHFAPSSGSSTASKVRFNVLLLWPLWPTSWIMLYRSWCLPRPDQGPPADDRPPPRPNRPPVRPHRPAPGLAPDRPPDRRPRRPRPAGRRLRRPDPPPPRLGRVRPDRRPQHPCHQRAGIGPGVDEPGPAGALAAGQGFRYWWVANELEAVGEQVEEAGNGAGYGSISTAQF